MIIEKEAREIIEAVANVLDKYLGDTDPAFPEDFTDEDIMQEEPIFWACRELFYLLDNDD